MEIAKVHTSCRHCCFAIYNGNTQIGCMSNELEKFKKEDVLEAYDEENREFYIINNRMCRMARSLSWQQKRVGEGLKTAAQQLKFAKKEAVISYQLYILIGDKSLKDVIKTLKSVEKLKIKPVLVNLIRPISSSLKPSELITCLNKYNFKWKIHNLLEDVSELQGINLAFKSFNKCPFYGVFNAGCRILPETFTILNQKVNDELLNFAAILPNSEGNGLIVLRDIHILFNGNKNMSLVSKLKEEKIECQTINQLVPSYPL